jgi:hypothetical protein
VVRSARYPNEKDIMAGTWEPTDVEVDAAERVLSESAGYPPDGFWRKEARDVLVAAKEASLQDIAGHLGVPA